MDNQKWEPDIDDICPDCGSEDVTVHIYHNDAHQTVIEKECAKCGATWGENL